MADPTQTPERMITGGSNPNYKVHLMCAARSLDITADMPEQVAVAIASEWENRFGTSTALGAAGMLPGGDTAIRATGGNFMVQELTRQIWVSSSPVEFPLTLIFDAEESAYNDVYKPVTKLMELNLPIKQGAILIPPGPRLNNMEYAVVLRIGRMYFIPDGILVSVNGTFDTRLDEDGFPIAGQVDLTVRTSLVYSNVEWGVATA